MRYRQHELDALFELLPSLEAVDGTWRGTLMAISGLGWLRRGVAGSLYRLLALPINPWRGKSFENGMGANRWFKVSGVAFGRCVVRATTSPIDNKPVTWLDYDTPQNLALLRPIRGEARILGDGLLLCRMNWQRKSGMHRLLYFTLACAE